MYHLDVLKKMKLLISGGGPVQTPRDSFPDGSDPVVGGTQFWVNKYMMCFI